MFRRKLIAVFVTLALVLALAPLSAFAEEPVDETSPPAQVEAPEVETPEVETTEEDAGESTDEEKYTLIVHYVDESGNMLADDFMTKLAPGAAFSITSPQVKGYKPDIAEITSEGGGMPSANLEYTVRYSKVPVPEEKVPGNVIDGNAKAKKPANSDSSEAAAITSPQREYTLTVVGEEKTPLSPGFLDSDCCVLHLILLILAMIALILYTKDMKKRQQRILELEEELEQY